MKNMKRISTALLSALLLSSTTLSVYADSASGKEEVIYIMTDAAGEVSDIEAVNIFSGGDIIDYGDYSAVKILNTTDNITQNGNRISFSSDADKVYYQGTMKNIMIPWNISIRYFLNNKEYSVSELAGQSGSLKILYSITKNDACSGDFYDSYALQTTFLLDTTHANNIVATDATVAAIGTDKQLSFTTLPGKGIETVITADVTDFEMASVSINAVQLNLNVDIEDNELMDKVTQLMNATKELDDGAIHLNNGTDDLKNGSNELYAGTQAMNSGVTELDLGIAKLQNGTIAMQEGLNTLYHNSDSLTSASAQMKQALEKLQNSLTSITVSSDQLTQLVSSSSTINQGIIILDNGIDNLQTNLSYNQYKAVMNNNGLNIDTLQSDNSTAISDLTNQISALQGTLTSEQIAGLNNAVLLLGKNNAALAGMETYLGQTTDDISDLHSVSSNLKDNYAVFDNTICSLSSTLGGMATNLSSLNAGVNELVNKYSELDTGINDYTNGVATIVSSYQQIVDGVSSLALGSKKLVNASDSLDDGANSLYDGVVSLCDGADTLTEGTNKLYTNTSDMDTQIQEQIDEVLTSINGNQSNSVSFVSDKNMNVNSVQFVIKTDAIEKNIVNSPITVSSPKYNFWQKLLHLFHYFRK